MRDRSGFGALILAAVAVYAIAADRPQNGDAAARSTKPPWWRTLQTVWNNILADNLSMMSAGLAFYALLAVFPGLSALISLYGLIADPNTVQGLLLSLVGILPAEAIKLLSVQLHALAAAPPAKLGLGLVASLALALWSAMSGTSTLMQALTVACEGREQRGFLRFYLTAAALAVGLAAAGLLALLLVAVIPAFLDQLPFREGWRNAVSYVRWPLLAGLAILALGISYRVAPSGGGRRWRWISPGAVVATLFWLLGSAGFSFYVARFGSYDRTYGAIGAVVVLLMWFYLTAYAILAGAELNAGLARRDSAAP